MNNAECGFGKREQAKLLFDDGREVTPQMGPLNSVLSATISLAFYNMDSK